MQRRASARVMRFTDFCRRFSLQISSLLISLFMEIQGADAQNQVQSAVPSAETSHFLSSARICLCAVYEFTVTLCGTPPPHNL